MKASYETYPDGYAKPSVRRTVEIKHAEDVRGNFHYRSECPLCHRHRVAEQKVEDYEKEKGVTGVWHCDWCAIYFFARTEQ